VSAASAPASRLAPCPCGSGRRYRDCCGRLERDAPLAPRSGYRAPGAEWVHLPERERDRLGVLMEEALIHQRAGRHANAERNYREVLGAAPATHDALHMLAMVRFDERDFAEARRLIGAALPLRPRYPALESNLALIVSAQRAQDRHALESLCEQALPRAIGLLRSADAGIAQETPARDDGLHLIGRDDDSDDGWMLRRVAELFASLAPVVWHAEGGLEAARRGQGPRGGVQVFVGSDLDVELWLAESAPQRTVVVAGAGTPSRWLDFLRPLARDGSRELALIVGSRAKAARFGENHHVVPPPIELDVGRASGPGQPADGHEFIVGCVVQDGRTVSHASAHASLARLAAEGFALHLFDPGRARYALGGERRVKCFSRRDVALDTFLAPLSCYLYRADAWWSEGSGRDLFGAMAAGVPVVCARGSIYAEYVDDGVDGLLYDDEDGALACLRALRGAPERCAALGAAARESARRRFDPDALREAYRRAIVAAWARS
jgi:hypothetical protein